VSAVSDAGGSGTVEGLAYSGFCLDSRIHSKFHYVKGRFPITLKYRHIYRVLNIDEIKN
jgi:hypothetical protein